MRSSRRRCGGRAHERLRSQVSRTRVWSPAGPVSSAPQLVRRSCARRGCDILVPRIADYDLTQPSDVDRVLAECRPERRDPPGGGGRRHRRQPRQPGPLLLRQRHHGHPADRAGPARRRGQVRGRRHDLRLPQVHARARSAKRTSGTAIRRRPTPPTASPRRCSWCSARPTGSSTASTPSTSCR